VQGYEYFITCLRLDISLFSSISAANQNLVANDMVTLQPPANNNWNQIGPENPAYSAGADA
jgi:hypothetical protein